MGLASLSIRDFRNISVCDLELSSRLNVIDGVNAAGKTSLLEAVFLLGHGRSFRTRRSDKLIRSGAEQFLVRGTLLSEAGERVTVGIERNPQAQRTHLAGRPIRQRSELVTRFPVQLVNPGSHQLLEGGPKYRRRFLDWGVFHVEPSFLAAWKRYMRVLRQRNAALRQAAHTAQIRVWDEELINAADTLAGLRTAYLDQFIAYLKREVDALLELPGLELSYQRGWTQGIGFAEALEKELPRDRERGFTGQGPHRNDLVLKLDGALALERLSRGQQKQLATAMLLAQARFFTEATQRTTTFLIDDLAAELDTTHRQRLLKELRQLGAQLLVTVIDANLLDTRHWPEQQRFHVKHGKVTEVIY